MISDLNHTAPTEPPHHDVCIIGGGIAGLALAHRLRGLGKTVVVLESGPLVSSGRDDPRNAIETDGRPYLGATVGRARGLGGTSSKWGGALIPFLEQDFNARPHIGRRGWPISLSEIAPYIAAVETLFQLPPGDYDEGYLVELDRPHPFVLRDLDILPRFAKWPKFRRRNVAQLLRRELESDQALSVWINSTVTHFEVRDDGSLASVQAHAPAGCAARFQADHFVLAAGAIESTRLALLLQRQTNGHALSDSGQLGLGFHDHVSMLAAHLSPRKPLMLNRLGGFRFHKGAMRSTRFELSPAAQAAEAVPSSFGHIAFQSFKPSGFDSLREGLRSLQADGRVNFGKFAWALADAPYLMRAAKWRYVDHQLLWPQPARYDLHVVAEQLPSARNRISLGESTDAFGMPKARIAWQVGGAELSTVQAFGRRFDAYWHRRGLDSIAKIDWQIDLKEQSSEFPEGATDIYHPGGTTAMATSAREGVVDANLKAFGVSNLSICATSSFPTGASANPTLMLLAFALRLGDHLAHEVLP